MAAKSVAHDYVCVAYAKCTLKIRFSARSSSVELGMLDHVLYCVQKFEILTDAQLASQQRMFDSDFFFYYYRVCGSMRMVVVCIGCCFVCK